MVPPEKFAFVIVSNRLPISVAKENGKLVFNPSSGGLATAMSSVGEGQRTIWVGWPGIASDELTATDKRLITQKLHRYGCAPVFLTKQQIDGYYDGYANATIWPLFHYFQNQAVYDPAYWEPYKAVNEVFLKAVLRLAQPNATIWVHDYHLMLLPRLLRRGLPDSSIGFFLHIPFPSYEIFRVLPHRVELLRGLLGANLVGFHTYDYSRHFVSSVQHVLGYDAYQGSITVDNRQVVADAFPISIDYQKFVSALRDPAVRTEIEQLSDRYDGQKLIISVDRLDYSKGIVGRLEAFDHFLERHPEWHGKLSLAVIAVPSRTDVDAYKQLRDTIELAVSRINGKYATMGWSPIAYQYQNLPFEQIVALYAVADIALVTPLRDGMNLVAKEYVAAKQSRGGVLILSEMAGAVHELAEAIRVNPYDTTDMVAALERALHVPFAEQRRNLRAMQARISSYSVTRWASDFIEQLARAKAAVASAEQQRLDKQALTDLLAAYQSSQKRLLLLDYDGTLRDFVTPARKDQARPSQRLLHQLTQLAADKRNEVCIISGRPRKIIQAWFGDLPLTLVAEHGAWIRRQGEWAGIESDFLAYKDKILPIMHSYAERTAGALVEEKEFSVVWHYRGVTPELASVRKSGLSHDLAVALMGTDIDVWEGNKILEVKPAAVNKGEVATELLALARPDFILSIGDDYTDEDMFEALPPEAWTIKVGVGTTQADYYLETVDEVLTLLSKLARNRI